MKTKSQFSNIALSAILLLAAVFAAKSAPRMPYPPMPEISQIYSESFDEPYEMATNQIDLAIWAESWSGWALTREQATVQPWIIPVLKTNSVFNIDPSLGGIRLWVMFDWSSSSTGQGTGPGQTARIATLVSTNGGTETLWWSLVASADGNAINVICQTTNGPATCLSGAISCQAGDWTLLTLGYSPTNSILLINEVPVAQGGGLPSVTEAAIPYANLVLGSSLTGGEVVWGQIEEFSAFTGRNRFRQATGSPFGIGLSFDVTNYFDYLSPVAALGPVTDEEFASRRGTSLSRFSSLSSPSLDSPDGDGGGAEPSAISYPSNALWLEVTDRTAITNGWLGVTLHGTVPNGSYNLLYKYSLTDSVWLVQQPSIIGAENQDSTFTWASLQNPSNIFLQARSDLDQDQNGIPDWWELRYFGTNGIDPYGDPDADGWSNLQEYQNGTDPHAFDQPPPPTGLAVSYHPSSNVATVTWDPPQTPLTGYVLERYLPYLDERDTFTLSASATSYVDTTIPSGSFDNYNPVVYRLKASHAGGSSDWSVPAQLFTTALDWDNKAPFVMVAGQNNHACLLLQGISLPGCTAYLDQVGFDPVIGDYVETNWTFAIDSMSNGVIQVPDYLIYHGASGSEFTVRVVDAAGKEVLDADGFHQISHYVWFYDGRKQMRDNLSFWLRAATTTHPLTIDWRDYEYSFPPSNHVQSGLFTTSDPAYPSDFDLFRVFRVNTLLRNFAFPNPMLNPSGGTLTLSLDFGGSFDVFDEMFSWTFPTSSDPVDSLLSPSDTQWIFSSGRILNNDIGVVSSETNTWVMEAGQTNFFGLPFVSTKFAYNSNGIHYAMLSLGGEISPLPDDGWSSCPYSEVAEPLLSTIGYYFGDPLRDPFPGTDSFSNNTATPLLIASVGEGHQFGGFAKQSILNGDPTKHVYLGQYFEFAFKADSNGVPTATQTGFLSPYGTFFPTEPGPTALVTMTNYGVNERGTAIVQVVSLALDKNHDGKIDASFGGPDRTTPLSPFVFWANNNYDRFTLDDDDGVEYDDDVSSTSQAAKSLYTGVPTPDFDFKDTAGNRVIPCSRDLQDFTRLWLAGVTTNLLAALPTNSTVTLSWGDVDSPNSGNPTIDLFVAADADGGIGYLTNSTTAFIQTDTLLCPYVGRLGPGQSIQLNGSQFVNHWAGSHFIWCGVTNGSGTLTLTIADSSGNTLVQTTDYIQIVDIKQMYERWTVGDAPGFGPMTNAISAKEGVSQSFQYAPPTDTNTPYILYVHGWNMQTWEKDRFAESAFKRLYWQGYQGRFGSFRWPTGSGFTGWKTAATDPDNYDNSEYTAWRSAPGLLNKLAGLNAAYPGHVYMLAHSMGNVVAGEALRLASTTQIVNTYIASQAAVPAHTYDNSISNYSFTFGISFGPYTPNIYTNWLAPNSSGVGRRINFYNTNDYALSRPHWELDQLLKPDTGIISPSYGFDGFPYDGFRSYSAGAPDDAPPWNHFFKENLIGTKTYFDIVNVLTNRYEVMSYAAQSRSSALGRTAGITTFDDTLDLSVIWPPDPNPNFQNNPYAEHFYHSAQFRGDCWEGWNYWNTLLRANSKGFNIHN